MSGALVLLLAVSGTRWLGGTPTSADDMPVTVEIDSRLPWQSTDTEVRAGTAVRVAVASGEWTYWTLDRSPISPLQPGTGDDYFCANIMPAERCVEPMPRERKGALIGRVGGGQPVVVGQASVVVPKDSGLLELRINDADHALSDNRGILVVEIGLAGGAPDAPTPTAPPAPRRDATPSGPASGDAPSAPTATPGGPLPRSLPPTGGGGAAG